MIHCKPLFYDDFSCIGSACEDNCCIGWTIEIDQQSLRQYKATTSHFHQDLMDGITNEAVPSFRQQKDGRCQFLDSNNLCEIYHHLGEEGLCDICANHPRYYWEFPGYHEVGLGICCPVAARLTLDREAPISFLQHGDTQDIEGWLRPYLKEREQLLSIAINRELTLNQRFFAVSNLIISNWNLSLSCDFIHNLSTKESIHEWIDILFTLDCLESSWKEWLEQAKEREEVTPLEDSLVNEHLMVYFIARHYLSCIKDHNPLDWIKFALLSIHIIQHIAQATDQDIPVIARKYSKEIEYSKENQNIILDELLFI